MIGPKHSGKTSTGRLLADILREDFFDLDEVMESMTGKPPRTLYREGINVFRKAETDALAGLLANRKKMVAASGGGLIDNPEAMKLLEKNERVYLVFLGVSAETAWKRIVSAGGELPAFLEKTNPEKSHLEIHIRRSRLYRDAADLAIYAEGKSPQDLALEIFSYSPFNVQRGSIP